MIATLFPGFLAAGALLAAVPVVLHLLSRRPPDRRPLPTARFLHEDPRTLLRVSRRPSDIALLVVRVLFALTLGACFAGMTWTSARSGVARIVLVDAEAATDIGMDSLAAMVRISVAVAEERGLATRVIAYAADESGRLVTGDDLRDLVDAVGEPRATALDGLRALRSALRAEADLDSLEAVWLMRPTWHQWTRGVGLLREALWPGALPITATAVGGAPTVTRTGDGESAQFRTAATSGFAADAALHRALVVLDAREVQPESGTAPPADWVFAENPAEATLDELIGQARSGTTVVFAGALPASSNPAVFPWDPRAQAPGTVAEARAVAILRGARPPLAVDGPLAAGAPSPHARVVAVFENARPAAAAVALDEGCLVYTAVDLQDARLTGAAGYVDFIDDLAHGCPVTDGGVPLDAGARTALARPDLPVRVALRDLDGSSETPLTPALLLLALALLGAEVVLTRRPRT